MIIHTVLYISRVESIVLQDMCAIYLTAINIYLQGRYIPSTWPSIDKWVYGSNDPEVNCRRSRGRPTNAKLHRVKQIFESGY